MQDLSTGEMRELNDAQLQMVKEAIPVERLEQLGELERRIQKLKDATISNRENQGPIFSAGEVLEIRGGNFRVHAITDKRLYLDSIPKES
jgi:hypothetical protein